MKSSFLSLLFSVVLSFEDKRMNANMEIVSY